MNSDLLHFKFSTEIKNILGRDLITNDYVAILELVKNSYDALATEVVIEFDDNKIVISDNGKGMSKNDLIEKWLFVGYSEKRAANDNNESDPNAENYRNKIKRAYAGAKGIGRLSCDRLAQHVKLITRTANASLTEELSVDWNEFEVDQTKEMGTINIPSSSYETIPLFPEHSTHGTILELTDLHLEWGISMIQDLRKSLEKMINPFSEVKEFIIKIIYQPTAKEDKSRKERLEELENKKNISDSEYSEISKLRSQIVNGEIENTIAQVLDIKTTKIESSLTQDSIITTLIDRGVEIYKIREVNAYRHLKQVTINLYYLNRAAKYNFTLKMGLPPTQYGSIFLFRNGFRLLPYGEVKDDSWGLDKRAQQGYKRFVGTRDLFGRVDVETANIDDFKEVSSREGGLIKTESSVELFDFFNKIHRRLERYVVGVLWGEGFLKNEYFKNQEIAISERKILQRKEKNSSDNYHIFKNIGSKVDFLQLIRSLANDKKIEVLSYNTQLADIVSDVSEAEKLQRQFIDNFKQLAESTNDNTLLNKIEDFEDKLAELYEKQQETEKKLAEEEERRRKAEIAAQIAEQKQIEAEKKAEEEQKAKERALLAKQAEENRRKEAELKQKEAEIQKQQEEVKRILAEQQAKKAEAEKVIAEKERDAERQQNIYLSSARDTSPEVEDLMHTVLIASASLKTLVKDTVDLVDQVDKTSLKENLLSYFGSMTYLVQRIHMLSSLITKADIKLFANNQKIDLCEYTRELVNAYSNALKVQVEIESDGPVIKRISVLDFSLVIENLISNASKCGAKHIYISAKKTGKTAILLISDDGKGVDFNKFTEKTIFKVGVTNTSGGSGIGLCTVRRHMKQDLNGEIDFVGNALHFSTGATFKLTFY